MIPGPIEISDGVKQATGGAPPSHVAPDLIEAFGSALESMRTVWQCGSAYQPYALNGSGTLAMEMAATNLVEPGDTVLVVRTGFFGDRMIEMLRRRGALTKVVDAGVGLSPTASEVDAALEEHQPLAVFSTHVDTSTGVRADARAICASARQRGVLSVVDGVCATAAERFEMEAWGADVYLTASQKAIGLPAGLALVVCSPAALARRDALHLAPPLSMDFQSWTPIMRAYEERRGSYFSTPATTLVRALKVGLDELVSDGMDSVFDRHQRVAEGFRAAWKVLGLRPVPGPGLAANTLSALYYPDGCGAELLGAIREQGVVVAGGLHPAIKAATFRVGHMGEVTRSSVACGQAVLSVGKGLRSCGVNVDPGAAVGAAMDVWG
jgi:alanine-glyoxylate transaminase / serine-glyoxylate transaminase / serine-pyruvate transaminase